MKQWRWTTVGLRFAVAPFTGAWIETDCQLTAIALAESHPSRVRGLKRLVCVDIASENPVAPFTGAWIETDGRG